MPPVSLADWSLEDYDRAARVYCANLPPEHFMEATTQGTQRAISLASLTVVKAHHPTMHLFNELLVQYPINAHLGQVVPDNMIVLTREPINAVGSYNVPFEPALPFWVLEYVSPSSERKDYEDNFHKYEQELKVPYYLLFYPEEQDLHLHGHTGIMYEEVEANARGRLAIPELKVEMALLDGWVRFWHRGKLVPLPDELALQLDEAQAQLKEERGRRANAEAAVEREKKRRAAAEAEVERLRALLDQGQPPGAGRRPKKKK